MHICTYKFTADSAREQFFFSTSQGNPKLPIFCPEECVPQMKILGMPLHSVYTINVFSPCTLDMQRVLSVVVLPPGVVHSSYSQYKSPPSTLCCLWRLASASLPHVQSWTTQLCCLCS